ncbi:MAG: 30S ribosomal protein S12 methylthiotransferase RimO [Ruthenibacterium sp.]
MKIALISLGCPKNQVDADVMCHDLLLHGHTTTADLAEADVILVNTCGFIESAKQEAIDNILEACSYKTQNPALKVVVTGCLAQRYQHEIVKEIPEVDAVVGLGSNAAICSILERLTGTEPVESYGAKESMPLGGKRIISTPSHYAYLKIAEGCNNRCHYCAIPLIRGPLRSRTIPDIVAEAKFLAGEGVKELIIVAQDITDFGADRGKAEIADLLDALNAIDGIVWIRLLYAYPERITDAFIAAMVRNEKVLHYLDVPIQHINSDMLKAMNRRGDKHTVLSALDRLRAAMPDITLRTTLITGYPGESEAQFDELCDFVKAYRFDRLGCFAYSEEEGTVAAKLEQLPMELREKRAEIIMRIQTEIMAQKQETQVGKTLTVLCDEYDDDEDLYLCRTKADAPDIDAVVCVASETPLILGAFYRVKIAESDVYDLVGDVVSEEENK